MKTYDFDNLLEDSDIIFEGIKKYCKKQKKKDVKFKEKKHNTGKRKGINSKYYMYDNDFTIPCKSFKKKHKVILNIANEIYMIDKNGITVKNDSEKTLFVSNVVPYVIKQIYEHNLNGETLSSILFKVHDKDMSPIKISASNLTNSGYISNHLPHGVIIKDYYRFSTFIKYISAQADLYNLYDHIGFTENIHGKPLYVHSGGVICSKKTHNTRSELNDGDLTLLKTNVDTDEIISCLDKILDLEPSTTLMLSFTLLSLCYSQYDQERPEFAFLLYGSSGTFKTSISTHIFNIFKEYYTSPPTNIKVATEASLHRLMGRFKDCVLLVDDAAPSVSGNDETYKKCENIVRAVGDGTGKMVAGRDNKINVYKPSGLIAITGEFVPLRDTSSISRCIIYKLEKGCIDSKKLSNVQQQKSIYVQFIIDYICWICDNKKEYIENITDTHRRYRNKFQKKLSKIHSRFPNNIAWLYSGFEMFSQFLFKAYSVPSKKVDQWCRIFETAIERAIVENKTYLKQQNDAKLFIETVHSLLQHKKIDLAPITIKAKNKKTAIETPNTIGYYDDTYVYIKPDMAYAVTNNWLHCNIQSGYSLPLQALLNSLKEQKMIIPDSDGRPKSRICLSGMRTRVIKLNRKKFFNNL